MCDDGRKAPADRWIHTVARLCLCATLGLAAAIPLRGQEAERLNVRSEVFAGSELEDYLRLGQLAGVVPLHPWSIRGFSAVELDWLAPADSAHPWADRFDFRPDTAGGIRFDWIRPRLYLTYNTAFPHGYNDGPVWAGRGLTTAVQAGFAVRYGPASLTIAPIAFRAENSDFALLPNGLSGDGAYRDPRAVNAIDFPQRFGDEPYMLTDYGESTLRLDVLGVTAGVSTAGQAWGPATANPLLLGMNAGGFPHLFASTSRPVNVGIGGLHGRLVAGRLDQSNFSPVVEGERRRLMTGLVAVFSPKGIDGLELGGGRFFHTTWPANGVAWSELFTPFDVLLKKGAPDDLDEREENQLASVFGRWTFPASGFEVYGEFAREDHSYDVRDLLLEPDHISAYTLGFHKLWSRCPGSWLALRAEVANTSVSHLRQYRGQSSFYVHTGVRQGHTLRGQPLGAAAALGGASSFVALDAYQRRGRWSVEWLRASQRVAALPARELSEDHVQHSLGLERVLFWGRLDIEVGLYGRYWLNREQSSDVLNPGLRFAIKASH